MFNDFEIYRKTRYLFLIFCNFLCPSPLFKGSIQLCTCWSVVMSNGSSSVLISEDYKLVALVLLIKELFIYYPIDLEDTMSNYLGH